MTGSPGRDDRKAAHDVPRLTLLAGLDPAVSAAFCLDLAPVTARPGQVLIEQGEVADQVYFVFSGRLLGQLVSENGREIAFAEILPGSQFGEIAALDGLPRSITVSAVEDCRLGVIAGAAFRRWCEAEPSLALALARDLAARNRRLTERIFGLVAHDVETRVRLFLSRLAQAAGELKTGGVVRGAPSHDEIATFVGANREAVSRAIARLAAAGVLDSGRRRILIRDVNALTAGL